MVSEKKKLEDENCNTSSVCFSGTCDFLDSPGDFSDSRRSATSALFLASSATWTYVLIVQYRNVIKVQTRYWAITGFHFFSCFLL